MLMKFHRKVVEEVKVKSNINTQCMSYDTNLNKYFNRIAYLIISFFLGRM